MSDTNTTPIGGVKTDVPTTHQYKNQRGETLVAMSPVHFLAHAKSVNIDVLGKSMKLTPREFATGSVGYGLNDKVEFEVAGVEGRFQISCSIALIGSKKS